MILKSVNRKLAKIIQFQALSEIKFRCFSNKISLLSDIKTNDEKSPKYNYNLGTHLYDGLINGDRFSLSRAITLVESTRSDHRQSAQEILNKITLNQSIIEKPTIRIGLSGPPGVGKSTFIETFGMHLVNYGHKVAVLAVDPSSTRTGGSILGDKTRMYNLSRHEMAYVRPTPSRGTLGGVARNTNEAILLCEAGGYDIVLVETVGVGQSETMVAEMVDMFVLLVPPAGGDELQGMKKGIMEISDLILVNKADGDLLPSAQKAQAELISALKFMRNSTEGWETKVLRLSSLDKSGIDDAWKAIKEFDSMVTQSKQKFIKRGEQQVAWMWREITSSILNKLVHNKGMAKLAKEMETKVKDSKITAGLAADKIVSDLLKDAVLANDLRDGRLSEELKAKVEKILLNF